MTDNELFLLEVIKDYKHKADVYKSQSEEYFSTIIRLNENIDAIEKNNSIKLSGIVKILGDYLNRYSPASMNLEHNEIGDNYSVEFYAMWNFWKSNGGGNQ